jgi:hypothetical protein
MIDAIRSANIGAPGIEADYRGDPCGVDPRRIDAATFAEIGHVPMSLSRVIRAKCLECCCGSVAEVRDCIIQSCPLWPYRMGSNPFRKVSEAQREQGRRLAALRHR